MPEDAGAAATGYDAHAPTGEERTVRDDMRQHAHGEQPLAFLFCCIMKT